MIGKIISSVIEFSIICFASYYIYKEVTTKEITDKDLERLAHVNDMARRDSEYMDQQSQDWNKRMDRTFESWKN